jgi:hypothetical protein
MGVTALIVTPLPCRYSLQYLSDFYLYKRESPLVIPGRSVIYTTTAGCFGEEKVAIQVDAVAGHVSSGGSPSRMRWQIAPNWRA